MKEELCKYALDINVQYSYFFTLFPNIENFNGPDHFTLYKKNLSKKLEICKGPFGSKIIRYY